MDHLNSSKLSQTVHQNDISKYSELSIFLYFTCYCIAFGGIIIASMVCCRKREKKTVMVLCADGTACYKYIFEKFLKKKLNINTLWLDRQEQSGKYIMLCNVLTRIPEDIQWVLNRLNLEDGQLCYDTMVVAMHRSEAGKLETVPDTIEFAEDPKLLLLTNMFYDTKSAFNCFQNQKAIEDIESFCL